MIPVFVISLARETERRASITSQLQTLRIPFTIIDAVDGRHMSDAEADRLAPGRNRLTLRWPLSKGEIACAVSHRTAVHLIHEGGHEFGCVMEDDAKPDAVVPDFLDPSWLRQLPPFDILKLAGDRASIRDHRALPIGAHAGCRICAPVHPSYSMICYVLSREGAARMTQYLRVIDDTADVMTFRRPMLDGRFLDVRPRVVNSLRWPTTLGRRPSVPWWRPLLCWAPHRIALWGRKLRRLTAFARANGIGAYRRVEMIPLAFHTGPAAGADLHVEQKVS